MQSRSAISSRSERLEFLDSMRAVAIIMVIAVHSLGYSAEFQPHIKESISFTVQTISVPVFFLVDGYLFSRGVKEINNYNYAKYVRGSAMRLLIPWAIFSSIYTLARYACELSGYLEEQLIVGSSLQHVVISSYASVYAPQLYFLCSLFLIRLCAPVFRRILFVKSYCALLLVFFCFYAGYRSIIPIVSEFLKIDGGNEPLLHALWGSQFFLAGIVVFRTGESLELKKLFMPCVTCFSVVLLVENNYPDYQLTNVAQYLYLFTFFFFFTLFEKAIPLLSMIGRNTMGVYLIHAPMVLNGVALIVNKFVFDSMLSFVFILVGTFLISVSIVMVVNRCPYGDRLFGAPCLQKIPLQGSK